MAGYHNSHFSPLFCTENANFVLLRNFILLWEKWALTGASVPDCEGFENHPM